MSKRVLITGGSGLVGRHLIRHCNNLGWDVSILSRKRKAVDGAKVFLWNPKKDFVEDGALDCDVLVHLAGAGVADARWTTGRKKEIMESRRLPALLLAKQIRENGQGPSSIISASGIGFYEPGDIFTLRNEQDPIGKGFLADVCKEWESSAQEMANAGKARLSILRIGLVMASDGGALEKMSQPIRYLAGTPLGTGKQPVSWIHVEDLCRMITWCAEKKLEGTFNAVAPEVETNLSLTKGIGKVLGKPVWPIGIPSFTLRLMLGEMADILLEGQAVSPEKIKGTGFSFLFPSMDAALKDLL
ncbi:NAD-dependent epimerase [Fulvitalea axinellae]|uniref:NAD-dependent epimerase n=1 Tax=Fulvitalea axinellae TaxID=1182444 RepID=A0AAU9CEV9_9BACT|nr:NAD-dependent epimerase [Fulvitalea axinellae]